MLVQRNLRVLHGQRQVFLREVEHVEDDVFLASVLTVVVTISTTASLLWLLLPCTM